MAILLIVYIGWIKSPKREGVTKPGLLLLLLPNPTQLKSTGNLGSSNTTRRSLDWQIPQDIVFTTFFSRSTCKVLD